MSVASSPALHKQRLTALRAALAAQGCDGFITPRADRFQGETVPPGEERLAWLTGFTGSAGAALVTPDRTLLIVDGRYTLQAAAQTAGTGAEVAPLKDQDDAIVAALAGASVIGFDPWLMTAAALETWRKRADRAEIALMPLADNPIDGLWDNRPPPPAAAATAHPLSLAGETSAAKRSKIGDAIAKTGAYAAVLTRPSGVNWLLNMRGADIPNTPVALAYAILKADGAMTVFCEAGKIDAAVAATFGAGVTVAAWPSFDAALAGLAGRKVALEKASAPTAVEAALTAAGAQIAWGADPTASPRACFNSVEQAGARAAHQRDGAAMAAFLSWLDAEAPSGALTEWDVFHRVTQFRHETASRLGSALADVSFPPIVGFNANGAVVHYRVTPETSLRIQGNGLLLVDSGGQYRDGTTDVTRTMAIGTPPQDMRATATRVLKGMIDVSRLRFPLGTSGQSLDPFARRALWDVGLDYAHGTGHGVGSYLGVHDGPQNLSKRGSVKLEPGMLLSNEPGCYRTGAFGVRLENLLLVRSSDPGGAPMTQDDGPSLYFETVTLVPIDRRLIDETLLSNDEIAWVDAYHRRVEAEIAPLVDPLTRAWLSQACAPL